MKINICSAPNTVALSSLSAGAAFKTNEGVFMVVKSATLRAKFRWTATVNLANGDIAIQKPDLRVVPLAQACVNA
jgi:hypothetical protein